jgi:hypothetical protein
MSGETTWTATVKLDVWRVLGGPVQCGPLELSAQVSDRALDALDEQLRAESVVRVEVRLAPLGKKGARRGELVRAHGADRSDPELNQHFVRLTQPIMLRDPALGLLRFDRRLGCYRGEAKWIRSPVAVTLQAESDGVASALEHAHRLFQAPRRWEGRCKAVAVSKLLRLKNSTWRGPGESRVTGKEFASRLVLQSVDVGPTGSFTFSFADGGLFCRHTLRVTGTLRSGPKDAEIAG